MAAQADRVAQALSYVLVGGLGMSLLIGDIHDWQIDVVIFGCLAVVAVLAAAPNVRGYFTGPGARQYDHPTSVVTARTLVAVWSASLLLVGLLYLPLGDLGGKYVPIGVLLLALGSGGFFINGRLREGRPLARFVASAGAVAYFILLLIIGSRDPSVLIPLMLAVGVVVLLWYPADAKAFFAAGAVTYPLPAWLSQLGAQMAPAPGAGAARAGTGGVSQIAILPVLPATYDAPAAPFASAPFGQPSSREDLAPAGAPGRRCSNPGCGRGGLPPQAVFCPSCGSPATVEAPGSTITAQAAPAAADRLVAASGSPPIAVGPVAPPDAAEVPPTHSPPIATDPGSAEIPTNERATAGGSSSPPLVASIIGSHSAVTAPPAATRSCQQSGCPRFGQPATSRFCPGCGSPIN